MTTVKPSKDSSGPSFPKKSYFIESNKPTVFSYLFTMLTAALLTTYIELWFTGLGYYSFPTRPYPAVFPVDIRFTLIVIPLFSLFALWIMKTWNGWTRFGLILLIGLLAMLLEPMIEEAGWIAFSSDWKHIYSFFGYSAFLLLIRRIHILVSRRGERKR